jgi:hypothetical protein
MIKDMKRAIRLKGDENAKIHALNWYLKQINQVGEIPKLALNPKGRPIKERLLEWIKEEISYIENALQ